MKRHDTTARSDCAARSGGAFVAGAVWQVAMLRNRGAMISTLYVSD